MLYVHIENIYIYILIFYMKSILYNDLYIEIYNNFYINVICREKNKY